MGAVAFGAVAAAAEELEVGDVAGASSAAWDYVVEGEVLGLEVVATGVAESALLAVEEFLVFWAVVIWDVA